MKSKSYKRNCELLEGDNLPDGISRWALAIEYNGAAFHGFQAQRSGVETVQLALQEALSKVADEPVSLVCAGRTDAGVHATNQIIHFDTLAVRKDRAWVFGTNTHLPPSVVVRWAQPVPGQFHARFSARSRTYRYIICNSFVRPALMHDQLTWQRRELDVERMREAARHLVGEHDFTSFRASQCQAKSPVRTIHHLHLVRQGDLIVMEVQANAFLHHMVRNIAGVLMAIGAGDQPPQWLPKVLQARDRCAGGVTAPAAGLHLVEVEYDQAFGLPTQQTGPHFLGAAVGGLMLQTESRAGK